MEREVAVRQLWMLNGALKGLPGSVQTACHVLSCLLGFILLSACELVISFLSTLVLIEPAQFHHVIVLKAYYGQVMAQYFDIPDIYMQCILKVERFCLISFRCKRFVAI